VKSNVTISIDSKILEDFNKIKGKYKISHLIQFWLNQFLDNNTAFVPIRDKRDQCNIPQKNEDET